MTAGRYETSARFLLADLEHSGDPERAAQRIFEQLEGAADAAEVRRFNEEAFLARAVELMQRAEDAHRAAAKAAAGRARIEGERRREKERLRKNARARELYRQRRLIEAARVNKRTGMHVLAIEVDPAAYRAVKLEAFRRRTTIPKLVGDILVSQAPTGDERPTAPPARWCRTGEAGERTNTPASRLTSVRGSQCTLTLYEQDSA